MSLYRQSLTLVLTTQNKQEKIHQKDIKYKINKLAVGKKHAKPPKEYLNQKAVIQL